MFRSDFAVRILCGQHGGNGNRGRTGRGDRDQAEIFAIISRRILGAANT
jgi:hypothetical protein